MFSNTFIKIFCKDENFLNLIDNKEKFNKVLNQLQINYFKGIYNYNIAKYLKKYVKVDKYFIDLVRQYEHVINSKYYIDWVRKV